jgi:hypothetical protein
MMYSMRRNKTHITPNYGQKFQLLPKITDDFPCVMCLLWVGEAAQSANYEMKYLVFRSSLRQHWCMSNFFLSLFVSIQISDAILTFCQLLCSLVFILVFLDIFLFFENFWSFILQINLRDYCLFFIFMFSQVTYQNIAVTVCTTSFNAQKFYILPTEHLYLLYVSQEKLRSIPCTTLNDRLLQPRRQVFTARYDLGL